MSAALPTPFMVDLATGAPESQPARQLFHTPPSLAPLPPMLVHNVTRANLTVHLPAAGTATGVGVVVCPGGGFHFLSIEPEGSFVATWLAERGIAAFVLEYRLVPTPTDDDAFAASLMELFTGKDIAVAAAPHVGGATDDGRRAVELVRASAPAWGLDLDAVGILGFSAGGYVAATVAMGSAGAARPDFVGAIYPVLFDAPRVPVDAMPLFLAVANDDQVGDAILSTVANLHRGWIAARRPVELHQYQHGGHGFGTNRQGTTSDLWLEQFHAWLLVNTKGAKP